MQASLTAIWLVLARFLGMLSLCYGVAFGVSKLVYPETGPLNAFRASESIYKDPFRLVANRAHELGATTKPQTIVLGSSTAFVGLPPDKLGEALGPDTNVHNVAVNAANLRVTRELTEVLYSFQSTGRRPRNTYVLGIWYDLFKEDAHAEAVKQWHTAVKASHLYEREGAHWVPLYSRDTTKLAALLWRPFVFGDSVYRTLTLGTRDLLTGARRRAVGEREINEAFKKLAMDQRRAVMATERELSEAQMEEFEQVLALVANGGDRLVVLNLPLPQWHRDRSPHSQVYDSWLPRMRQLTERSSGAQFMDFSDMAAQSDFIDSIHPSDAAAERWCTRLARELAALPRI